MADPIENANPETAAVTGGVPPAAEPPPTTRGRAASRQGSTFLLIVLGIVLLITALVADQEAALTEPPDVGAGGARLDHSSSRTIRTPATRFSSFRFAAQRAVWLRPQSVENASRSGGASCANRRTRAATSSGVST